MTEITDIVAQTKKLNFNIDEIQLIKTTILDENASDDELKLFSMVCQRTGLDPFSRQVYGIRRKGKLTFQTSIDGYRLIADRTEKYAGNDDAIYDEGLNLYQHIASGRKHPTTATITVWKVCGDQRCPFTASAAWSQYAQSYFKNGKLELGEVWAKMPHVMLAKCAESLALRKAFPAELSGMYTREEMPADDDIAQQAPTSTQQAPVVIPNKQELELLHPVQQAIIKMRWTDKQESDCLSVLFGKRYLHDLTNDELLDIFDYLCNINISSHEIKRLGWDAKKGKEFLEIRYKKQGRHLLTISELSEFVDYLREQPSPVSLVQEQEEK